MFLPVTLLGIAKPISQIAVPEEFLETQYLQRTPPILRFDQE